ncbi:prenyltransferase/squalene oxidase repeat-containing protein [Poritiphilus flavus]|uniref:Squalene cyclase C-terminal domain-containing protein n=1 Tax=Poritiphilus flavus TaxID=2697053 RepID=A0A6L9E8T5_9FLAO|nr:hypothetical protein [Poritiphilus flavus]NAS11155.1 hypothetical protein [Poritiphilus flavus]
MKTKLHLLLIPAVILLGGALRFFPGSPEKARTIKPEKGCVFMTVMGEQSSLGFERYKSDENMELSVRDGLQWLSKAQLPNGGYGAGSHSAQHIRDPHAVKADPATTAMVGMAFLRSGTTLQKGIHANHLKKALNYLLETIESAEAGYPYITKVRNTQIQTKLGENIDAVLASQFLSSILDRDLEGIDRKRVSRCLDICISRIEAGTDESGKQRGAGWAGVLQSGLASSALEAAQAVGATVDEVIVERSKSYQKSNYDEKNTSVKTTDGAGIVLYAVSGSVRASAKEARKVKSDMKKARKEGRIPTAAEVSVEVLEDIGYSKEDAMKYNTSYEIYESAKLMAQDEKVMDGFGNNGGEEFLSYLQTGESLLVSKDESWKKWYDDMSGRILKIQNSDGSWSGHHCITSPVFCTATSLMLLTVEEDIDFLQKIGEEG